ncbi:structural maintenance of chromosomes protein 5-like, partial [Trifolium pratense]
IKEVEANIKQHEDLALQASLQFNNAKKEAEECRQNLTDLLNYAKSIARLTPNLEKEFLEVMPQPLFFHGCNETYSMVKQSCSHDIFFLIPQTLALEDASKSLMPTTIEELEAAIQDTTSQANSILFVNSNILEQYEDRQRQIEDLATKLDADKKEYERCKAELENIKGKWLPTLRNLVAKINETFSQNFRQMAVAGEVSLDEHDIDFDQYGIHIKVKFRENGELEVLSAHHQSGGERSVSTIVYLVSLQDLTNCPFRVVDEINQGMDPINERKMFQQLVRAASKPNTPQ